MDEGRVAELLTDTPLGEGLSPEDLRRLAALGEVREIPPGERLLVEGERDTPLVVVLEGEVEVLMADEKGQHHCLLNLGQSTVLGEISVILDRPVTATVRTTVPAKVFVVERGRFGAILEAGDRAAAALALSLARVLATRLQRMNEEAVELCERYDEALAQAGTPVGNARVAELARFKQQLLTEWNF